VGDCTDRAVVEAVMRGEKANMSFVDPPYNISAESGRSRSKSKRNSTDVITPMLRTFMRESIRNESIVLEQGACVYTCIDYKKLNDIVSMREEFGYHTKGCIVWAKPHFGMGAWYRRQYELLHFAIFGFRSSKTWRHDKGDVWQFNTESSAQRDHASQKPIALVTSAIEDATSVDDIVIDLFVGTGTTLIACERLNRRCRAIEIEPKYCAVTIQRWVDLTGGEPRLIE